MKTWTRCGCGHIAQDHDKYGVCGFCSCQGYDGRAIVEQLDVVLIPDEAREWFTFMWLHEKEVWPVLFGDYICSL